MARYEVDAAQRDKLLAIELRSIINGGSVKLGDNEIAHNGLSFTLNGNRVSLHSVVWYLTEQIETDLFMEYLYYDERSMNMSATPDEVASAEEGQFYNDYGVDIHIHTAAKLLQVAPVTIWKYAKHKGILTYTRRGYVSTESVWKELERQHRLRAEKRRIKLDKEVQDILSSAK